MPTFVNLMNTINAVELSVVVPCYQEEKGLYALYERLIKTCERASNSFEIIMVNDGSHDNTWAALEELSLMDRRLIGVNLARNYGHQIALTAGLSFSIGQRVLIIDADLQDPPELLPEMMALLDAGCDVAYGQRRRRDGETWFKTKTAGIFYQVVTRLVDFPLPRDTGDFRLMSRRAVDILLSMPEQHRFIRGMVSWIGLRQEPVFYDRCPRFAGDTNYTLKKMFRLAIDAISGFSIQPLRIASIFGMVTAAFSVLMLVYILFSWYVGRTIEGWTSLMVVVLTMSSVQLLVLGIFGEYLGRLFIEAKRRPLFVVERVLNQRVDQGTFNTYDKSRI